MNICETKDFYQRLCPVGIYIKWLWFPSMLVGGQFSLVKTFYFFPKETQSRCRRGGMDSKWTVQPSGRGKSRYVQVP